MKKRIFFKKMNSFRVKSPITNIIGDNIFEGMTYMFNILLLFDFVLDFQNKNKFL